MQKEIIAIDVDDVLAASAQSFVDFSNKRWGTNLTIQDYDENWFKMWRVDHEEGVQRALDLHQSGVFSEHRHFNEAESILLKLSQEYTLVIVTSRRLMIQKETRAWLDKHFGDIFEDIVFAGIYDNAKSDTSGERFKMTKAEILKDIGARYLIDDQPKHCYGAADVGVQAILFGDYPWNQADHLPANVTRCKNWQEIAKFFGV